ASTSKKSLELALREAIRARSKDVRDEHLALGILRADDDGIRTLLPTLDVDARALRDDLEGRGRRTA
ncbi:MAG TPA: Clp protease N-terminal domain-containing protein, partial [Ornithinibacter sp.]|nr:Clp protease N-terminal domain-containing protein [Ornithinibacter sp.]